MKYTGSWNSRVRCDILHAGHKSFASKTRMVGKGEGGEEAPPSGNTVIRNRVVISSLPMRTLRNVNDFGADESIESEMRFLFRSFYRKLNENVKDGQASIMITSNVFCVTGTRRSCARIDL